MPSAPSAFCSRRYPAPLLKIAELRRATDNFSPERELGRARLGLRRLLMISARLTYDGGHSSHRRGGFGVCYAAGVLPSIGREGGSAVKLCCALDVGTRGDPEGDTRNHRVTTTFFIRQVGTAREEILKEIRIASTCRHESLLPLLGFCLDMSTPCLVCVSRSCGLLMISARFYS